jgi:hypothetical protein
MPFLLFSSMPFMESQGALLSLHKPARSLSCARRVSPQLLSCFLIPTFMLTYHPLLGLSRLLLPSGVTRNVYSCLSCVLRKQSMWVCPPCRHSGEERKLRTSSLSHSLQRAVTLLLLRWTNLLPSSINLSSSVTVRDRVSQMYETTGKIRGFIRGSSRK